MERRLTSASTATKVGEDSTQHTHHALHTRYAYKKARHSTALVHISNKQKLRINNIADTHAVNTCQHCQHCQHSLPSHRRGCVRVLTRDQKHTTHTNQISHARRG